MKRRIKKTKHVWKTNPMKIVYMFLIPILFVALVLLGILVSPNHDLAEHHYWGAGFGGWILFLFSVHVVTRK